MKRLLILVATAGFGAGCVNDNPLFVTGLFSTDPTDKGACELSAGQVGQLAGSLDLTGGASYELLVILKSELDPNLDTKADMVTLVSGQQRNTIILDQINFTYSSTATATIPSVTFEPETVPITGVVAPGGTMNVRMGLLGRKAYVALSDAVKNPGESSDIRVKFEFSGAIITGGRVKSTPITFPITVYRSGTPCPAGETFCRTGPCGNVGGQDGSPLVCSTAGVCPAK